MRMRLFACVVVVIATVVASASATESTIYSGIGIGQVRLRMTPAQVERVLGKDFLVNERTTVGGARYLELGWNILHQARPHVHGGQGDDDTA